MLGWFLRLCVYVRDHCTEGHTTCTGFPCTQCPADPCETRATTGKELMQLIRAMFNQPVIVSPFSSDSPCQYLVSFAWSRLVTFDCMRVRVLTAD